MDFMYGCDKAWSVDFKDEIVNDIVKEVMTQPRDLIAINQKNSKRNKNKSAENDGDKQQENMICLNCQEKGQLVRDCPKNE